MADENTTPEEVNEGLEDKIGDAIEKIEGAVEDISETVGNTIDSVTHDEAHDSEADEHHDHHYTDDVILPYFGHIATMPGGIYTFIFFVLGALTLIEVLITIALPENAFSISLLVLLSLGKAVLVVMYYMHLNRDNWIFRIVVLIPLIIVLFSTLYLIGIPSGAGLGY